MSKLVMFLITTTPLIQCKAKLYCIYLFLRKRGLCISINKFQEVHLIVIVLAKLISPDPKGGESHAWRFETL